MISEDNYPGWKINLQARYYNNVAAGKIFRRRNGESIFDYVVELEDITVLIDIRLKPKYDIRDNGGQMSEGDDSCLNYNKGRQMWADDDFLGSIIADLREQDKIARCDSDPQSSRFGVSSDEWESHIKPVFAVKLNLAPSQLRLERAIEANFIPQTYIHLPRKDDARTNTWVWYEERFRGRGSRFYGGHSDFGGIAGVYHYHSVDDHWPRRSFRPLAVL